VPGKVATTFTISVGRLMRAETGAIWLSNATCSGRAGAAALQLRLDPAPRRADAFRFGHRIGHGVAGAEAHQLADGGLQCVAGEICLTIWSIWA
jgi:hypothetical protein